MDFDDFLTLMTKKMTEKDETEDLQKAFWLFDEDGTGKISRANLDRVAIELGYDPDKMQDELQVYEWKQTAHNGYTCTGYNLLTKHTPILFNFIYLIESVQAYFNNISDIAQVDIKSNRSFISFYPSMK